MKQKICTLFILVFFCATLHSQQVYTLEMCRKAAIENNKSSKIAELTEEKTEYDSKSYFANFFPRISASGLYFLSTAKWEEHLDELMLPTYVLDQASGTLVPNIAKSPIDGSPIIGQNGLPVFNSYGVLPTADFSFTPSRTWFAGLQAEQPIFMGGKIVTAYKMSKIGREIARLNITLTREEITVKTDEAFFLHLKALQSKKVAVAFQTVVEELYNNVKAAYQTGMKTRNDVLKVQVQLNKAELQIHKADNAIRLSRMNLCQTMGLPVDSEINISEEIPDISPVFQEDNSFTSRPEYSILEKQLELKSQQIRLVRSDFLPSIGILANYGYLQGLNFDFSVANFGQYSGHLLDHSSFSALLSVKIPLFHWGEGYNKIRAAKAEKQILQMQKTDLNEKMELEMRQALDRVEESQIEVSLTANALLQAEENMDSSRRHYENGMETLSGFLEAQTMWQQTWLENIEAKINLKLNETKYHRTIGEL